VFALADRLHKTPAEIRREITIDDLVYLQALDRIRADGAP
jgi:hypothetical protein